MSKKTLYITQAALIAAIYVVLVIIFKPISFTYIQVRIAEALTILPYFTPAGIPGVTIGCLLANVVSGSDMLDIIFGTLATLVGAIGSYVLRKHKFLIPLPPILANSIVVPWILRYAYAVPLSIPFMMLTVGIGEVISCGIIGLILLFVLNRHRNVIFRNN
ncbi:QueT transporter family protein [Anaerocolumna sp. AGMB13025]|uniref:QueT transporter family protein n=1 Tax=Anaerocolumna sp. AGMB13025 TaxID=3039116 RepID=UPI00241E7A65|nr:QueT transporter family protein [Anaerocolumna sp. AGMB13025]WFR57329.1 QueT transporter family protein [Anaerocolumna sp. AGMB13025]